MTDVIYEVEDATGVVVKVSKIDGLVTVQVNDYQIPADSLLRMVATYPSSHKVEK